MTPYRFDNKEKKNSSSRKKRLVITVVVIIVIMLTIFVIAPFLRNIARGPQWLAQSLSRNATDTQLKIQEDTYQAQTLELKMLQDENHKLRTELSYLPEPRLIITARVIAKPSQSLYNSLVIDQGSAQGLHVGQVVTVQHTIGLGRISSISSNTATVDLFSNPRFKGDLVLKSQSITLPATGKGGGNFEIHIPREINVVDGDILALPELPEIAVGVVKSIIFDSRDPFQTVLARVPVNVQELEFVEVVK